jgi:hypothetical protein
MKLALKVHTTLLICNLYFKTGGWWEGGGVSNPKCVETVKEAHEIAPPPCHFGSKRKISVASKSQTLSSREYNKILARKGLA